MDTTTYESPTQVDFYRHHDTDALRRLVNRLTSDSLYMETHGGKGLASEAMLMANAAWAQLVLQGAA